jgi:hypothetical protein
MLDFQDLVVYVPDESRVVQRTPAAIASSSLALCQPTERGGAGSGWPAARLPHECGRRIRF